MLPYAAAIFLGAFLLFQIEPILGKYILPWFGGGPGVWATCLAFFQSALVAGYLYAHWLTRRVAPRKQAIVHIVLLAVALAWLPIIPAEHWKPEPGGNPALQILWLLTAVVGLPFVVLAATGPLVQEWFRRARPGESPYRLYALSNLGSLLALLSYPFVVEWSLTRHQQSLGWAAGCAVFAVFCALCAWNSRLNPPEAPREREMRRTTSTGTQALWVALPALASALLVATTNKLCLDLAAAAFLWVLPLALYLLSFVLCFDHPRWYRAGAWSGVLIVAAGCVAKLLLDDDAPLLTQVLVYGIGLLAGCMVCHGELVRLRPEPRELTRFYVLIAAGGALGGLAVALAAPAVFQSFAELPICYWLLTLVVALICVGQRRHDLAMGALIGALAALLIIPLVNAPAASSVSAFLHGAQAQFAQFSRDFLWPIAALLAGAMVAFFSWRDGWSRTWTMRSALFSVTVSAIVGGTYAAAAHFDRERVVSESRNFFGVLTVYSEDEDMPQGHYFMLMHGRTTHGAQFTDPARSREPTTYYGHFSGVGRAIDSLPTGPRRLGLVGLGTGTLTTYVRPSDAMRIYEIDRSVEALARSRFTFLKSARGPVEIVPGDARLSIEREVSSGHPPQYDVLALDAFSSDAIPVHLLTKEAFALYLKELAPDGILAVHISNRYFDLEPVVANLARNFRMGCVTVDDDGSDKALTYNTRWVLLSRDTEVLMRGDIARGAEPSVSDRHARLWTDDFSSLWQVLR